MTFVIEAGVITLGVALGLTVFQYVVLPIGSGIERLKELIDERGTSNTTKRG